MKTDIEYLRRLDIDLGDAAVRETSRLREAATPATRRRPGQRWIRVAGVAAAFLVVAGAIGFLADGGARDMFRSVGHWVASDGDAGGSGPQASTVPNAIPPGEADFLEDGSQTGDVRHSRQQDHSKIVRDGRIGIVVPDGEFGNVVGDLTFIAERHGGFILSSSTENERSGTFVLRIPARRFDRAIGDVRDLGTIRSQEISGEDVTAEFIDFQARLRILQARKALLFDLFQQADTTEEILQMGRQVDEVHLQIERIQGELRFIRDQVAVSTLRVSIQERNAPEAAPEEAVDNPDLGSSFDLAVQGFLRIVGAVIVGLGYLVPLTVLGALVWMAVWLLRRRRAVT